MLLALLLLGSACATKAAPVAKYCPVPVYPDDCALEWMAAGEYPACVSGFLDSLQRQQEAIAENCTP